MTSRPGLNWRNGSRLKRRLNALLLGWVFFPYSGYHAIVFPVPADLANRVDQQDGELFPGNVLALVRPGLFGVYGTILGGNGDILFFVVDLVLAGFVWDPGLLDATANDQDDDGDGLPDESLTL